MLRNVKYFLHTRFSNDYCNQVLTRLNLTIAKRKLQSPIIHDRIDGIDFIQKIIKSVK